MPLQIWSKALAISGILTMGLALLGCLGALKELRCLLGLYFGILLLLFVTQITLGILISTQRTRLERKVKDIIQETIQNYYANPENTEAEESWDYVQFQLRCCGWNSPEDWYRVPSLSSNESVYHVPCSCRNSSVTNDSSVLDMISPTQFSQIGPLARPQHSTELCTVPANSNTYREGCSRSLQKWLHNNLISIVGICLGVGLLEVSVAGLTLLVPRRALRGDPPPQVPAADGWCPEPGLSADGGGVQSGSGRSGSLWGGWGMADACPNWVDKVPQGKLPMALGPWPLWEQDEEQPEIRSTGAEVEAETELQAEAERETDEPPK
ncbi:leukocyte antigen CD37 isoform X2 [Phyllostomus discolor]|nr:leukocyte antigen CD37 isoform X2 [Phyllostomus discolor]